MIDKIKAFFTPSGWKSNWKDYSLLVLSWAIFYVLGAFGGAFIQFIKDAVNK